MMKKRITAVAVVDNHGKLVGNFSVSDLKVFDAQKKKMRSKIFFVGIVKR
jgi:hypothetical protein